MNYLTHSLNKSGSKAAYSFPRSNRIQNTDNKSQKYHYYDLPSLRNNRATSMGYGNKTQLGEGSISPSPDKYKIISEFQRKHNNSAIAFGKSRDQIKFGSFLENSQRSKNLPAPNQYKINFTSHKRAIIISERLKTDMDYLISKKNPGPGDYSPKNLNLSDSGSFFLSNLKNQRSPRYHNPQQSLNVRKSARINTVGPASYNTSGHQFGKSALLSKFKNSFRGSFSKALRKGLIDAQKAKVPGAKYTVFSEFGTKKM